MIQQILDTIQFDQWKWLVPWMFGLSIVVFFGSIVGVWFVLIRLPEDYLTRDPSSEPSGPKRPIGRLLRKVVLNIVGVFFLLIGLVMLLTPGQGILSIFVGITLMDFPGKRNLIRKILMQPKVFNAINKLRMKSKKPPLASFVDA